MLSQSVPRSGDVLPDSAVVAAPVVPWSFRAFERGDLVLAVAAFPAPRSPGQDVLSGSWGVSEGAAVVRAPWVSWVGADGSLVACEGSPVKAVSGVGTGESIGLGWREGRTFRVTFGPGLAVLASHDATRRERAADRLRGAAAKDVDLAVACKRDALGYAWALGYAGEGERPAVSGSPFREVTEWSLRSRARMVKAFGAVDFGELERCYCGLLMATHDETAAGALCGVRAAMPLGMVTLTYPGHWLAVAADGAAAKRHLILFRKRWFRALGFALDGAWKLEFQRPRISGGSVGQRAPHFHLLVPVPALVAGERFDWWLARTWAECVDAEGWALGYSPDLGYDAGESCEFVRHLLAGTSVDFSKTGAMSDPRRCGVYFLKHGTKTLDDKEFQHIVPDAWTAPGHGPGRFWGFWGLKPSVVALDLDAGDFYGVRRVLRHVVRGRARSIAFSRVMGAADGLTLSPGARGRLARLALASAAVAARQTRTLGVGGQLSGGFAIVNDGLALAVQVRRAVELRRCVEVGWGDGEGLEPERGPKPSSSDDFFCRRLFRVRAECRIAWEADYVASIQGGS